MQASSYSNLLAITANSAWDTWHSYSSRACNDTATVYRWYVATFFSEAASRRYQWIGEMIGCGIALVVLPVQRWAESEVQSCLTTESTEAPTAPQPITESTAPQPIEAPQPQPQPIAQPAIAQVITEAITLTIPTESSTDTEAPADLASILATMTSAELRKECQSAGIRWRNARGQGKHLAKAAMVEAMVKVEASTEAPAIDYSTLKTPELRRLCTEAGIRWRNARGQGKHLRNAEMIEALMAS